MRQKACFGRVVTASLIGTTIEWYDFFLYGSAAALVFNHVFFPESDPLVGTMLAFTTCAVGFVAHERAACSARPGRAPIPGVLRDHWREAPVAMGVRVAENVSYYVVAAFTPVAVAAARETRGRDLRDVAVSERSG